MDHVGGRSKLPPKKKKGFLRLMEGQGCSSSGGMHRSAVTKCAEPEIRACRTDVNSNWIKLPDKQRNCLMTKETNGKACKLQVSILIKCSDIGCVDVKDNQERKELSYESISRAHCESIVGTGSGTC
jgi:hypothetical protein